MENKTTQLNLESMLRDAVRASAFAHKLALLDIEARHRAAWYRSHYDPNQPRVPAGNSDGGQWTSTGAGPGHPDRLAQAEQPPKVPPQIPRRTPPTPKNPVEILGHVLVWLLTNPEIAVEAGASLQGLYFAAKTYFDPPKSLKELQTAVSNPQKGYDIHHIVEQGSAEQDGFPKSRIDASDNLVRIPRVKHWEINSWYSKPNEDFGGLSPRDYLRGKDWAERRRIGLETLVRFGVLGP